MTRQQQNRYSMDGFVPSGQNRHVGFEAGRAATGGDTGRMRARPVQRAGGRSQNPLQTPQYQAQQTGRLGATRQQGQQHQQGDTDFRSYTVAGGVPPVQPAGGRRQRGKVRGKQPGAPKQGSWFRRVSWKKVFKRTVALTAIFLLLAGGWFGYKFLNTSTKVFGGDTNVLGFLKSTKLKGEDQGRVNVLLAGVSTDDPDHAGAALADSIMIISLDTKANKAMMMSIPRDLWVDIPGYGHSKINAASAFGDEDKFSSPGYPEGGMGLLAKTVTENFEMPIHYYAKINYSAFRDAVNAVGGIDVTIKSDDPRGLYDPNIGTWEGGPLKLTNGPQKLDGQTALNLARARGNPPGDGRIPYGFERSDFTRTAHQRMMMLALKDKVSSSATLSNPVKISQLFDVVGKNLKTDFEPSEIRRLYDINKQVKSSDIASVSLNDINGVNMLASYRSPEGQSALIPAAGLDDFSQIQVAIRKIMSSDPVVKESARIVILNGGDITGLASRESNNLTSKGLNVVAVGDAPRQAGANVIIDKTVKNNASTKPGTKARLQQLYKGTVKADDGTLGYPSADFIIILGTDHRLASGSTSDE